MPRAVLNYGDEVSVYFTSENAAPYRIHGLYRGEDDQYVRVEGTVGDLIGHDLFIPKDGIKMIERAEYRS